MKNDFMKILYKTDNLIFFYDTEILKKFIKFYIVYIVIYQNQKI